MTAPPTMAATPAQSGMFTRLPSTFTWMGPISAFVSSFVYQNPP
jgi:hypothetical protein